MALAVGGVLAATPAFAQVGTLSRGNKWFLKNGLQIMGTISDPTTKGDPFNPATYAALGYTAQLWEWHTDASKFAGQKWGRWVNNPSEMPPQGGEAPYLAQLTHLSIGDEPNLNDSSVRDTYVNWFNSIQNDPAYANVLLWANNWGGQIGNAEFADFIARAKPDMIANDTYPYAPAAQPWGGSPTNWYSVQRVYRQFGIGTNTPFGIYRQTYASPGGAPSTRAPSESELRLQTFAGLAFNAKSFQDFSYNFGSSAYFNNAAGGDNSPNALYTAAQSINAEAKRLGTAMVRLKPIADTPAPNSPTNSMMIIRGKHDEGAGAVNNALPSDFVEDPASTGYSDWEYQRNDPYWSGWAVTNLGTKNGGLKGDVIVSWFKPSDGWFDGDDWNDEVYMMVVNGLADMNGTAAETRQQIIMDFTTGGAALTLQKLDRTTGAVTDIVLPTASGKRRWTLQLDGGTGELFKFKTGAPFVGTMPTDTIWKTPGGGAFYTATNWESNLPQSVNYFAHFGYNTGAANPYTITFSDTAASKGAFVHGDNVTWNLNGFSYSQSGFAGVDPFIVGMKTGENASLTITSGTVSTAVVAGQYAQIGKAAGATGSITLGLGAIWNCSPTLLIGKSGTGTLNVTAGLTAGSTGNFSSVYLGGSTTAAGGTGVLNVSGGTANVAGTLKIWNSGAAVPNGSRVNLSAGTLKIGTLDTDSNPARFNFTGGTLDLTASNLVIGSGGAIGSQVLLATAQTLRVSGAGTSVQANSTGFLTLRPGGTLYGRSIDVTQAASFGFTGGTIQIDGGIFSAGNATNSIYGGSIIGTGGFSKFGSSTVTMSGTNTYAGPTRVAAGKLVLGQSLTSSSSLTVETSAIAQLSGGADKLLKTGSITANGTGQVDLGDNLAIVRGQSLGTLSGSTYSGVTGLIQRGRNGGTWNGGGLVTSMSAALTNATTLAIVPANETQYFGSTFAGISVIGGDVLLMYTYTGDANLDGTVNADDYAKIDLYSQVAGSYGYSHGDFNYDGSINADDYALIDKNSLNQGIPFAGGRAALATSLSAVPEPAALPLILIAAGIARRRRVQLH